MGFKIENGVLKKFIADPVIVKIPNEVITIEKIAFRDEEGEGNDNGVNEIIIPDSVISIEEETFAGFNRLSSITVDHNNSSFCSVDGVLYNKNKAELICYPAGKSGQTFVVPDTVKSIWADAFELCEELTSVTLSTEITKIEWGTFRNCTNLAEVIFPAKLTEIDDYSFCFCQNLVSVTLPDGVISIGRMAFARCISLESITIPRSVTTIQKDAFRDCSKTFCIHAPQGSYAIEYAKENKISYKEI